MGVLKTVCCVGALGVVSLLLISELVVAVVTELCIAENPGAGDDRVVDTEDEGVG